MLEREMLGATRERMLRELAELLEALTATDPLLLVLEDLQWVDPSTTELLSVLARRREPAKLLVIATQRPIDARLSNHPVKRLQHELSIHQLSRETALQPLSQAEVAEYLGAESPGAVVPEGLEGLVYRQSEGNPLFMGAALEQLTDRGFLVREDGAWHLSRPLTDVHLGIPERLRQLVEAQIDRLNAEEQRVLEAASAAGVVFLAGVTAAAADLALEAAEDMCNDLARRSHLIRGAGFQQFPDGAVSSRYQFIHALYREALYDRLGPARRARLHLRIGECLAALSSGDPTGIASELADHFEQGGAWTRAIEFFRLAANASRRCLARSEEISFLRRALRLVPYLPETERAQTEIALLETLATTYIAVYDPSEFDAALEAYQTLADRAAHYGRVDVEVRALIEQAFPLSWISSQRSLEALERALRLGDRIDPVTRTKIRSSCASGRIWANGWDAGDAEESRAAVAELAGTEAPAVLAQHRGDFGVVEWASSRYREALMSAAEGLPILAAECARDPYLTSAYIKTQMIGCWSLMSLGQLGLALQETKAAIAVMEKNGNYYRAKTMELFVGLTHHYTLDFEGTLAVCESVFPSVDHPARSIERRLCLALAGLAETGLGSHVRAVEHLSRARDEIDRHAVILSWWVRMLVEQGFTESALAQGDLGRARRQAARFLETTLTTPQRTFQALAWEANARVAIAASDLVRARECIDGAVRTTEGFEVPLAAWRVHATAATYSDRMGDGRAAERHRELSRATILALADSLPSDEPLRSKFLSAQPVRDVLDR